MNFYSIFYWLTISDSVKSFFDVTSNLFTTIAVISSIGYFVCVLGKSIQSSEKGVRTNEEEVINPALRAWEMARKYFAKFSYTFLTLALIMWIGYVFTPTKKDCLLIIAGGAVGNFITTDSSAKQLPSDVTKFLHLSLNSEIENLSNDAKQDIKKQLGMQTPKEKLIDDVKNLSKEQILEYLKKDTTIKK